MTPAAPAYHVCLVVEDLDAAMAELGDALGLTWARIQQREVLMESPTGPRPLDMRWVYSFEGPPHLELIERRDDSTFDQVGLHHLGLWSDDSAGESDRLDGLGWPRETVALAPDGSWAGALFHQGTCGLRVEVVDVERSAPRLANYLAGGDYTLPD